MVTLLNTYTTKPRDYLFKTFSVSRMKGDRKEWIVEDGVRRKEFVEEELRRKESPLREVVDSAWTPGVERSTRFRKER